MIKKSILLVIAALITLAMLGACQRSASQAPVAEETSTGLPLVQTSTGMGQIEMIGTTQMIQTMTAVAQQTVIPTQDVSQPTSTMSGGAAGTPGTFVLVTPTPAVTQGFGETPVVIVPTSTPGRPASYILMQGEFPYCIARRFNVNQSELLSINNLSNATAGNLPAGYELQIPQTGNTYEGERARNAHPTTYTVTSGSETVYSVACYFGDVDPTQIIAANNLISPYTLHVNQTLSIP
jgi:LysM repeat protein